MTSGPVRGVLLAHVDDGHRRQRPVEHAPLEDDALVPAGHRVVVALHRRRRRAEHDQRAGALAAHDRDVAPVVARALFLLVRARRAPRRRRSGRRCSSGANTAERVPTTTSTSPRRMRCHWSWRSPSERPLCWMATRVAERLAEQRGDGRGQGDLRHEHQHAPSGRADRGREPQVDLGLAAAGDAVQQRDAERAASRPARAAGRSAAACSPVSCRRGSPAVDRRRSDDRCSNGSRSTRSWRSADRAHAGEPGDRRRRDPARRERRRWPCRRARRRAARAPRAASRSACWRRQRSVAVRLAASDLAARRP